MSQSIGLANADASEQARRERDTKQATDRLMTPTPSGKAALLETIHQLRYQADVLQSLYNALPERLTPDQSAGLNTLLRAANRKDY